MKAMREEIRSWKVKLHSGSNIESLSECYNAILRGWFNYYGKYCASAMRKIAYYFNDILMRWAKFKYQRLRTEKLKAKQWLRMVARKRPQLFVHWQLGYLPS